MASRLGLLCISVGHTPQSGLAGHKVCGCSALVDFMCVFLCSRGDSDSWPRLRTTDL